MASIEVMKERARIAGRFNLSACRNPEHNLLGALAAQKAGGECPWMRLWHVLWSISATA